MKKLFLLSLLTLGLTACATSPNPEPIVEDSLTLTEDLLVSGDWGPVGVLGAYIEFNEDGTYLDSFAGEGGAPVEGAYQIEGEKMMLTPRNGEAPWSMTLGESADSLYYTVYLTADGSPKYWDRNTPVPAGSKRIVDSYSVIIVDSDAQVTPEATPKAKPEIGSPVYEFRFCAEGCEVGEIESFAGSFTGVLARTETKETVAGLEDYWYLVGVELGWYSGALIDGEPAYGTKISYAWVHGSELQ
ncbi:MAG: hypothetical protein WC777_02330 [Candidatus Gracilibacteria bacterium]|jgi:hypothetical protein